MKTSNVEIFRKNAELHFPKTGGAKGNSLSTLVTTQPSLYFNKNSKTLLQENHMMNCKPRPPWSSQGSKKSKNRFLFAEESRPSENSITMAFQKLIEKG